MKVFYLITKSTIGGAQTHIEQMTRHLKEQGDDFAVMSQPGGWLEGKIKEKGGTFYNNQHLQNTYNPFLLKKAKAKITEAISDYEPDLVSTHSTVAGFLGRMAVKNEIPTLFTAHGWAFTP